MVEMNLKALGDIAERHPVIYSILKKRLKGKLQSIYHDQENDMLLLSTGQEIHIEALLEQHMDKTGVEAFWNKISLDDCFPFATKRNSMGILACGLHLLAEYLTEQFPSLHVVLCGSTDGRHASLRFHLIRNAEKWLSDSLKDYQQPVIRIIL